GSSLRVRHRHCDRHRSGTFCLCLVDIVYRDQ
ncbi:hypothetical protein AB1N83_013514, partial [Pleurotus pulmonarius]